VTRVERILPTDEAYDLLDLAIELADRELAPRAADFEARGEFPRDAVRTLGRAGLFGLPYPEEYGGGGQPYEVYLQVLEEIAARWLTAAEAISVHTLSCYPVAAHGTDAQRKRFLPDLLSGARLGAYCLSEPAGGSDPGSMTTRARRDGEHYVLSGTKAWITHAGVADAYNVFCRTGGPGPHGISCLLADAATPGIVPQARERTMGLRASPVAQIVFDDARVPADRLVGDEGAGFRMAMQALDAGRLGIAACAVGLAQGALDHATVSAARALTLSAARLKDAGRPYSIEAAKAKLFATDAAMRVTTDAVQVLGGYGYVADHPVERYLREAKVLQIVEGTNQIQRLVIARDLARAK
jgi:alkylation response protein AidB-like acyl-CoA dehydrogenase